MKIVGTNLSKNLKWQFYPYFFYWPTPLHFIWNGENLIPLKTGHQQSEKQQKSSNKAALEHYVMWPTERRAVLPAGQATFSRTSQVPLLFKTVDNNLATLMFRLLLRSLNVPTPDWAHLVTKWATSHLVSGSFLENSHFLYYLKLMSG